MAATAKNVYVDGLQEKDTKWNTHGIHMEYIP